MPELPEVEVICQGLLPHLINRTIISVHCSGKQLRSPVPCNDMQLKLAGKRISSLSRRAKYLILKTDNGGVLIIHLGMTGNMGIFVIGSSTKKHDHVCWKLDNGTELRFNDTRRFGAIHFLPPKNASREIKQFFAATGPEPFSRACSVRYLSEQAARRKIAIKKFIMDSHVIAGIGNIYANETLFRSGIHPEQAASSLSDKEWKRLLTVMRKTLKHAIECGGSTISDFLGASGDGGYFQMNFRVYGKAGEECMKCGELLLKKTIGGRSSFFCPKCQVIKGADSNR
ncbi:MAG TPA: bifunctional DNA-formamidopyrimidine glycosylase/DNA-(apurinic or apyrimidinic site) lyase [Desulfobacterales bacterium]|nr:bifunctional DNA-formamidopyrimidine glycosylase/DNA-(apurinic or apyrimidinic site) lyase [Desulfobacterales bacterium]